MDWNIHPAGCSHVRSPHNVRLRSGLWREVCHKVVFGARDATEVGSRSRKSESLGAFSSPGLGRKNRVDLAVQRKFLEDMPIF